jgi:hypothetical protein
MFAIDSQDMPVGVSQFTAFEALPRLLSVNEVRVVLRLSKGSAYRFCRRCGFKVGKLWRVPREALQLKG